MVQAAFLILSGQRLSYVLWRLPTVPFVSGTELSAEPVDSLLAISTTRRPIGRGALAALIMVVKFVVSFGLQRSYRAVARATGRMAPVRGGAEK